MDKINVCDKIIIEKQKTGENVETEKMLQKSPSKRSYTNRIHSLLKRPDARENADLIYVTHIASFGQT